MFQDSVPAGSYNDPFLSSVFECVCACMYTIYIYIPPKHPQKNPWWIIHRVPQAVEHVLQPPRGTSTHQVPALLAARRGVAPWRQEGWEDVGDLERWSLSVSIPEIDIYCWNLWVGIGNADDVIPTQFTNLLCIMSWYYWECRWCNYTNVCLYLTCQDMFYDIISVCFACMQIVGVERSVEGIMTLLPE